MGTTTTAETNGLARVHQGDRDALAALLAEHLHPVWRIAVVAAPDAAAAETAAVEGFCDGLVVAHRQPDPTLALRVRLVTAARNVAATSEPTPGAIGAVVGVDPVLDAFRALPEAWRTALWLTEVEGGRPEQVGPALGLSRGTAANLADRASAGLRERLAADIAARAVDPSCQRALSKLPAHAAGKLTAAERDRVGEHIAGCGSCALWLAALIAPRPALRRLIPAPPVSLAPAIEARWLELLGRHRTGWITPFTERAIGAAAAALLAVGLAGATLFGGRDSADVLADLAAPSAGQPLDQSTSGTASVTVEEPPAAGSSYSSDSGSGSASSSTSRGRSGTPITAPADDAGHNRSGADLPSSEAPAPAVTPTTTEPGDDVEPTPPATDAGTQVQIGVLGGAVAVGLGDCTGASIADTAVGCAPSSGGAPVEVEIALPGIPTVSA